MWPFRRRPPRRFPARDELALDNSWAQIWSPSWSGRPARVLRVRRGLEDLEGHPEYGWDLRLRIAALRPDREGRERPAESLAFDRVKEALASALEKDKLGILYADLPDGLRLRVMDPEAVASRVRAEQEAGRLYAYTVEVEFEREPDRWHEWRRLLRRAGPAPRPTPERAIVRSAAASHPGPSAVPSETLPRPAGELAATVEAESGRPAGLPAPSSSQQGAPADRRYRDLRTRGLAALAVGDLDEAVDCLQQAAALHAELGEAHLNLGRALERAGRIESARRAFLRALELDARLADARAALAVLPPRPPTRQDFAAGQLLRSASGPSHRVVDVKRGGFGVVYIVEDDRGSRAALKTFQARFLWSDEDRTRFEREALTWILLERHPHVVTAQAIDRIAGFPCLVLEFVTGGDLAALLERGPLAPPRATALAVQFCDGMAYAHDKLGIVHRDVKPSNCLLTETGSLKVTDFGLARAFGSVRQAPDHQPTPDGAVSVRTTLAGTRAYMAPEQLRSGAVLDTRTDIYGFGVMFFEMLTGRRPLVGSAALALVQESEEAAGLPEPLVALVAACVQPRPADRPGSFPEVRRRLEAAHRALVGQPPPECASAPPATALDLAARGQALGRLGRFDEALRSFEKAIVLAPADAGPLHGKGQILMDCGRLEEALACFERCVATRVDSAPVWTNRGLALERLGRHTEALESFDRGRALDPDHGRAWWGAGLALTSLGRTTEALACFDRALRLSPEDANTWLSRARLLWQIGRVPQALESFDRGLAVEPRHPRLWSSRGDLLEKLGRHDEALACYERALEIEPGDARNCLRKALALWALQRHREAVVACDRGLMLAPHDEDLWLLKGRALDALGLREDAIECVRRARWHERDGAFRLDAPIEWSAARREVPPLAGLGVLSLIVSCLSILFSLLLAVDVATRGPGRFDPGQFGELGMGAALAGLAGGGLLFLVGITLLFDPMRLTLSSEGLLVERWIPFGFVRRRRVPLDSISRLRIVRWAHSPHGQPGPVWRYDLLVEIGSRRTLRLWAAPAEFDGLVSALHLATGRPVEEELATLPWAARVSRPGRGQADGSHPSFGVAARSQVSAWALGATALLCLPAVGSVMEALDPSAGRTARELAIVTRVLTGVALVLAISAGRRRRPSWRKTTLWMIVAAALLLHALVWERVARL